MKPALVLGLASLACLATIAPSVPAGAGPSDTYAAAGTVVVKSANEAPVLDNGGVVCVKSNPAPSIGGGCVDFGASVEVVDAGLGRNVAFQVCIDNNGDGECAGGESGASRQCDDDIFFSHDDKGAFFNPLGRLPGQFRWGCPGGPWEGYVVFLCDGVHNAGQPHGHTATTGSIHPTPLPGTGFGDFCQPHPTGPAKQYIVR